MWRSLRSSCFLLASLAAGTFLYGSFGPEAAQAQTLDDRLAKANPAKGEVIFVRCGGCHSIEEGGPTKLGPNLWGIIDRPVASVDGYAYSDALKEYGGK
jgi:cytochrome c